MNEILEKELSAIVKNIFGEHSAIIDIVPVSGGCINSSMIIVLNDRRKIFVKQNGLAYRNMFIAEANGLELLKRTGCIKIPDVIAVHETAKEQFLFLEYIDSAAKTKDFYRDFGEKLAKLHCRRQSDFYGLENDNYIGSTVQVNEMNKSWTAFFAEKRLLFQIELANKKGRSSPALNSAVGKIIRNIDSLLPEPSHPSLLHGDLWGGNYMIDEKGEAVLIDPAVYYGHFEADLAMTELFGGFGREFYDAYDTINRIDQGYQKRKNLYNLYHVLNHLNLFGGSYLGQCISLCRDFI